MQKWMPLVMTRSALGAASATILAISLTTSVSGARSGIEATATHGATTCGWSAVPTSSLTSHAAKGGIELTGLAAISSTDVWVTDDWFRGSSIAHWNGKRWTVYQPPRKGVFQEFYAIAAASPHDIWAVGGDEGVAVGELGNLIDHWNGSDWTRVRHIPITAYLDAVAVMPNHHLWAAGGKAAGDGDFRAYVVHWSGDRWIGMTPPVAYPFPDPLNGIAPISPNDVLAVSGNGYAAKWNGKRWTALDFLENANAVSALSATDAWAVGDGYAGGIEHWNGVGWSVTPFSAAAGWDPDFLSVSPVGPDNVWAVGDMSPVKSSSQVDRLLAAHWNGTAWTETSTPAVHAAFAEFTGVSTLANGDVWAVGNYGSSNGSNLRPLIEHYTQC